MTNSPLKQTIIIIGTLLISLVLLRNLWKLKQALVPTDTLSQEVTELQQQVTDLEQQNQQEIDDFQREVIIRNELNMQREGEIVLNIPKIETATAAAISTPSPAPAVYSQWLELLF